MFTSTQQDQHGEAKIRRSRRKGAGRGSMYRGVRMRKWGRWVSEIRMPDKRGRIWLGSYESPRKAALAYDFAEFHLRGPRARLNFPDTPPSPRHHHLQSPRQIQAGASHFANQHHAAAAFSTGSGSRAAKEAESAHRSAAYVAATLSEGCCVTSRSATYVADTLSEGCCVSSSSGDGSGDDSVVSEAAVLDYEGKGKLAELQLDEAVLDSLRKFLADHSHTDWWLAS